MDLMEVYKHLTDQEREEYAALEETFSSKGWQILVKRANERAAQLLVYGADAPTWEANRVAAGMREVWDSIVVLREATDNEYANIARERVEEALDEPEDSLEYE